MIPMDHAAAHERISDLALERRVSSLDDSQASDDMALREHVATCDECRTDLEELRQLQVGLTDALAGSEAADVQRISAPPELRAQVLRASHSERARAALAPRRQWRLRLGGLGRLAAGAAAALAIVIVVGSVVVVGDQSARLQSAEADRRSLAAAVSTVSRVLADPTHKVALLSQPDGNGAGSLAWTRHDLVVLADNLTAPAAGQVYRCWVVSGQGETSVGAMDFVSGQAFWVGSLDGWAAIDLAPGYRFLVSLEPTSGGTQQHTGPVVLQATLGA
jgi:anti-sigma factor RsiW